MGTTKTEPRQFKNLLYKDRFQFVLSINNNIICQRYFRINGFRKESLEAYELKDTLDKIVLMLKNEMESKSRTYLWYTCVPEIEMTGFWTLERAYKTYMTYEGNNTDGYIENIRPRNWEHTFKFAFLVDEKVVYERIWDAGVYPKYVRNSVDLTNSDAAYRGRDPMTLPFNLAIIRRMTAGRDDLTRIIIRKICDVMSSTFKEKNGAYKKWMKCGNKFYECSLRNSDYIDMWRAAVQQKTEIYRFGQNGSLPQSKDKI